MFFFLGGGSAADAGGTLGAEFQRRSYNTHMAQTAVDALSALVRRPELESHFAGALDYTDACADVFELIRKVQGRWAPFFQWVLSIMPQFHRFVCFGGLTREKEGEIVTPPIFLSFWQDVSTRQLVVGESVDELVTSLQHLFGELVKIQSKGDSVLPLAREACVGAPSSR